MHKKIDLCTIWFPISNMKITASEILNFSKEEEMGIRNWGPIGLLLSGVHYYLKMNHRHICTRSGTAMFRAISPHQPHSGKRTLILQDA